MPWKNSSVVAERERFAVLALKKERKFAQLCRDFGISRETGYKWCRRHREEGRRGLEDRARAPHQPAQPQAERWRKRALQMRRVHPHWGAEKLREQLAKRHGRRRLPSVRTVERWLRAAGLVRARPRRVRRGPPVPHPGLTVSRRRHEVWTVDFKGWYRTGDGQRQEPLTVRDLHSRYLLAVRLLPDQSEAAAHDALVRIFRAHGLPEAIRVDNGVPFGGKGALGLTRLSVWWLRLGIRVEFTRRARPGDNAGHEQMHGLYAREVAPTPLRIERANSAGPSGGGVCTMKSDRTPRSSCVLPPHAMQRVHALIPAQCRNSATGQNPKRAPRPRAWGHQMGRTAAFCRARFCRAKSRA
jgi:putative transposase